MKDAVDGAAAAKFRAAGRGGRDGGDEEGVSLVGDGYLGGKGDFVDGGGDPVTVVTGDH